MSNHLQKYGSEGSIELTTRYSAADEPLMNVEGWKVANPDYGQPKDMSGLTAGEKLAGLLDDPLFRAMKRLGRTMLDGTVTLAQAVTRPWQRPAGAHRAGAVALRKAQEAKAMAAPTVVLPVVAPTAPLAVPVMVETSPDVPAIPVHPSYGEWDGSPPPLSPVVVVPGRHSLSDAA